VRVERTKTRARGNRVELVGQEIVVRRGFASRTPIAKGLENWFRKQARIEIAKHLKVVTDRLRRQPGKVYIMGLLGKRTGWNTQESILGKSIGPPLFRGVVVTPFPSGISAASHPLGILEISPSS